MSKTPNRLETTTKRMGHVEMSAEEIDFACSYVIEFEADGRFYQWTGARPERHGEVAVFEHGNGRNGIIVEMDASLKKVFAK